MRPRSLKPPLPSRPPWWLEEAEAHRPEPAAPPLAGPLEVNVAVGGGGYTGLWTALALREREPSLRVALLEAREIGDGPSGRNGGFLHGYWSSRATLQDVLGDGVALQLAHASSRIVPAVRAFLRPIDVSADRLPRFDTVAGTRIHYGAGYSGNGLGRAGSAARSSLPSRWAPKTSGRRCRSSTGLRGGSRRSLGGHVVRWGTLASEEASGAGRRPSAAASTATALPRLLRLPIGTR